jgi:hypothetical protein
MDIASNVDQVERASIRYGAAAVSDGLEDERLAGIFIEKAVERTTMLEDEWEVEDEVIETVEGNAIEEIEERAKLLGEHYPFSLNGTSLRHRQSHTGLYEFCLAASIEKYIKHKPYNRIPIAFERVAAEAVRYYLGRDAIALRTGWPSHDKAKRPIKFKDMAKILQESTGEWVWAPRPPNPPDPHHRKVKDAGVDFVVWKPMPDQRPGKLFVLGQCACGNDWDTKLHEPDQEELDRWFRPATYASFQKVFAMPRPITNESVFSEMGLLVKGIVFDRIRLTALVEENLDAFTSWKNELAGLTKLGLRIVP